MSEVSRIWRQRAGAGAQERHLVAARTAVTFLHCVAGSHHYSREGTEGQASAGGGGGEEGVCSLRLTAVQRLSSAFHICWGPALGGGVFSGDEVE